MNIAPLRRYAPIVAALALLILMVGLSRDFGFTWDERMQQKYGENIWDYYHGRVDRDVFDDEYAHATNIFLYGGLVELTCVAVQHVVHADIYVVRHGVVAVFGWLGIVFSALLAARIAGPRAGWLAGVLLVISPRLLGDSMNNPKDLPFAALVVVSLYCLSKVTARPPFLTVRQTIALGVAIALTVNVRSIGLVLVPFALAVVAAHVIFHAWCHRTEPWRGVGWLSLRLAIVSLVVIPAASLTWPWAQSEPFWLPLKGFWLSSQNTFAGYYNVLYQGQNFPANGLPWHYVPVWLLIGTPAVVLCGIPGIVLAWRTRVSSRAGIAILSCFAGLPILAVVVRRAIIHDAIRHLTFTALPLVILSAIGWDAALGRTKWRGVVLALLLIGVAEPVIFQLRNHPNQSVYFNPLMGGPRAAFLRYDMDYWGNSMLQATAWSAHLAEQSGAAVVVTGNPLEAIEADAQRFRSLWVVPRASPQAELDIRLLRGPRDSLREFAQRPDILYRVTTADGTPLSIVLPGPAYANLAKRRHDE